MRILTWNINGIRTIPQYHREPHFSLWNTMKTHDDILNLLQADITCFKMKSSRQNLPKAVGVPALLPLKTGYSGVAVYARTATVFPCKAEEGLTGLLQPKPPLSPAERVSVREAYPDETLGESASDFDFRSLDSEGRALVVDLGCSCFGYNTRWIFHRTLEARVKGLIEVEKREVIVVGDLNACAAVRRAWRAREDSGRPQGPWSTSLRRFWPDRKAMYTCWNTKISARESNYGTRIDYILVTPGLLPWIQDADIQPEIKGSDHCPVFIDLRDEIIDTNGGVIKLRDSAQSPHGSPPSSGTSTSRGSWTRFFGKKAEPNAKATPAQPQTSQATSDPTPSATLGSEHADMLRCAVPSASEFTRRSAVFWEPGFERDSALGVGCCCETKTRYPGAGGFFVQKVKKDNLKPKKPGQTSLASFFSKSTSSSSKADASASGTKLTIVQEKLSAAEILDADYKLALSLSQESSPPRVSGTQSNGESKKAWSTLLAPVQPPLCQGKNFFICSRPVGPGYDRGKAERLREEVDPTWRCDFFKWASDVRLEMARKRSTGALG
ncbi:DNase I-like protein [Mycena olivaceomarginata]|nr:DNase I-like protein [Mycena olivaceomarginata]